MMVECPRWHDGALWVSDMRGAQVLRFSPDGARSLVVTLDGDGPGGLGWLPDGRLLVVGMERRVVYVVGPDGLPAVHAELGALATWDANDMVVADDGTAYVSQTGFDLYFKTTPITETVLMRVDPDGTVGVAADRLLVPNGMTLDPTGTELTVAETWGERLTRFRVDHDGRLVDRTTLATVAPAPGVRRFRPDGICADEAGGTWVADFSGRRVLRVDQAGTLTHQLDLDDQPLAVVLGGPQRRQLFICLVPDLGPTVPGAGPSAHIDVVEVDVPGAGRP
jgi:sugar lactone lactonase YvrE